MSDLLSGLEGFGLENLNDLDIYGNGAKKGNQDEKEVKEKTKEEIEQEVIFEKTSECPVCDHEFKIKAVRTGKVKLVSQDPDLRPKYQGADSLKYDAIVCPKCGYAALTRFFQTVMTKQAQAIRDKITPNFKGLNPSGEILTYDDAIDRHKLALVNSVVKNSKSSEKAYTCLKLAWLYRGKRENMETDTPDYDKTVKGLKVEELGCLKNAYEGFVGAFSQESFPMCGMDEDTVTYLVADLSFILGKLEESSRWTSGLLVKQSAKQNIKDKARVLKEKILATKK